jgi:hypothetical protein
MNLLQEYLLEQALLNESLDDAYAFYKEKLSREQFDKLIAVDPTFNVAQDRLGTYGKWIIKTFLKGDLKEEDFPSATEVLYDYNERKKYITIPGGKDIGKYKDISEIRAALDTIQLTDNQREKLRRKAKQHVDLGEQAEFIFETDEWEVWSPLTYAASLKLGGGSSWCTASTGDRGEYYYRQYTSNWPDYSGNRGRDSKCGKLFIFNNKKDSRKKFQLQVSEDENGNIVRANEFRNINDNSVDFASFILKEKLADELLNSPLKNLKEITESKEILKLLSSGTIQIERASDFGNHNITLLLINEQGEKSKTDIDTELLNEYKPKNLNIVGVGSSDRFNFKESPFEVIYFNPVYKLTKIQEEAFSYSKNLKKVVLPFSVEVIGTRAFKECVNLEEIFLPDSVRYIEIGAFEGCRNVVIKMNKRDKDNPLKVTREDLPFFKQHIQIIDNKPEEQTTTTESILTEVFSPSMPDWLQTCLRNNKANVNTKGDRLRVKILGTSVTDDGGDNSKAAYIDLNNAEFVSIPVPTNVRSQYLREPYLPIYKLQFKHYREDRMITDVYIPGINDKAEAEWQSDRIYYGNVAKTTLLLYTVAFCYIDTSNPKNFSKEIKTQRAQARQGSVTRDIKQQGSRYGRTTVDKSGYESNQKELEIKLSVYAKENYSKILRSIYNRINAARKNLRDFLFNVDIKKASPYDEDIQRLYDKMFSVINKYRAFKQKLEEILAYPKSEKIKREYQLYSLFNVPVERMTYLLKAGLTTKEIYELGRMRYVVDYNNVRQGIRELEDSLKSSDVVDFE